MTRKVVITLLQIPQLHSRCDIERTGSCSDRLTALRDESIERDAARENSANGGEGMTDER